MAIILRRQKSGDRSRKKTRAGAEVVRKESWRLFNALFAKLRTSGVR
jgi:hypothetical protein